MAFTNRISQFLTKIAFGASPRLYGRFSSGAGFGEEIGIGDGLVIESGSLKAVAVNLGNLTTSGFTTGHMLRIKSGGGIEGRTTTQVLSDIGGQAVLTNYSTITGLTGFPGTSTGGLGASDSGKMAVFGSTGSLTISTGLLVNSTILGNTFVGAFAPRYIAGTQTAGANAGATWTISAPEFSSPSDSFVYNLPSKRGTFAMISDVPSDVVRTSPQTLTEEEKAQVQQNFMLSGETDPSLPRIAVSGLVFDGADYEATLVRGAGTYHGYDYFTDDGGPAERNPMEYMDGYTVMAWYPADMGYPDRWQLTKYEFDFGMGFTDRLVAYKGSTSPLPVGLTGWTKGDGFSGTMVVGYTSVTGQPGIVYRQIADGVLADVFDCAEENVWVKRPSDAVRTSPQTLDTAQQAQARGNIGAAGAANVSAEFTGRRSALNGTRVAVIGDSTAAQGTTVYSFTRNVQTAMEWYSCGRVTFVSPPTRSANGIAIGGADSREATTGQSGAYMIAETVASDADSVVIMLGANDVNGPSYDFTMDAFAEHYGAIITACHEAGKPVAVVTPFPGGSQDPTGTSFDPYPGTYNEGISAVTGKIKELARDAKAPVIDLNPYFESLATPGLWDGDSVYGPSDGIHPPRMAYLMAGREIARRHSAATDGMLDPFDAYPHANLNPCNIDGLGALSVPGGTVWNRIVNYVPRRGGISGERFIDWYLNPDVQTIGSGTGKVTYTAVSGKKFDVNHYFLSAETRTTIGIESHIYQHPDGEVAVLRVRPKHTGFTMQCTAAEVVAAFNADPVASLYATASLDTAGDGTISGGGTTFSEMRTSWDPAVDAFPPAPTDLVRLAVEVFKHPAYNWPAVLALGGELRGGATSIIEAGYGDGPWPAPIGDRLIITSPWVAHTGTAGKTIRFYRRGYGWLRIGRMAVQYKPAP